MTEQLLKLPEKPGTVIAIGAWWLVRLRPYGNAPSAWELLPMPDDESSERAKSLGVRTQCVYGDEWVLAEAEQEGGYAVISDPRDTPSGVQYFQHVLARAAEPEPRPIWDGTGKPPVGARVRLTAPGLEHMRGEIIDRPVKRVLSQEEDLYANVRWDGREADSVAMVQVVNLVPEREQ